MKVNLKDIKEMKGDYEVLPVGWYHVKVEKAEIVEKEGKAPYANTWFVVVEGIYSGRYIFRNFIFTEAAMGFMKPFLLAINYAEDQEVEINPREWVNEQLLIYINHRIYNGKPKEDPIDYKSLDSAGKTAIEQSNNRDEEIPF